MIEPADDVILGSARTSLVLLRRLRANGQYDPDRDKIIADLETYLLAKDGFVDPEGTIYDSKAIKDTDWYQDLLVDGWQFLKREAGVIYLRKRYG